MSQDEDSQQDPSKARRRKRRWGDAAPAAAAATPATPAALAAKGPIDSKAKALALKESIAARLAALKAKTGGAAAAVKAPPVAAAGVKRPAPAAVVSSSTAAPANTSNKRAKHYELDMTVTGPTFNNAQEPSKPKVNPYLAHRQTEDSGKKSAKVTGDKKVKEEEEKQPPQEEDFIEDNRLQPVKVRQRHRPIRFVEPGTFVEIAERKRQRAANAELAGFASGRKQGTYYNAQTMANIYGSTDVVDDTEAGVLPVRPEANPKTDMPHIVEWWDLELLPSKRKKQVAAYESSVLQKETEFQMQHTLESTKAKHQLEILQSEEAETLRKECFEQAALNYCKTATLIQHIVPIKPLNASDGPPVEPTLYLTKKELKRQRKLRRQEKQRELQDLQSAGLIKAPEPRLTLKNFIKVLGDQAYLDPSQMEQTVRDKMQARQRAHLEHNAKNKLTKEQRAAKKAARLEEDTNKLGVHVALFFVKDMSHPYHRAKVDLNAQQFNITGGVIECEAPKLSCVICEGGPKALKKYIRLMTVRMKWKGPDDYVSEDEEEEEEIVDGEDGAADQRHKKTKFNPDNHCDLVWQGLATKRFFKGFIFQACESGHEAAKILRAKGVGHFWDQILTHASGKGETMSLKLARIDPSETNDTTMLTMASTKTEPEDPAPMEE